MTKLRVVTGGLELDDTPVIKNPPGKLGNKDTIVLI